MSSLLKSSEFGTTENGVRFFADKQSAAEVVRLAREFLDRDITARTVDDKSGYWLSTFISDDNRRPLTIPEKAVIAAFGWLCREYTPGLKRNAVATFPKIIYDQSDEEILDGQESVPFADEARAYMFAEVVESCFNFKAQVIGSPTGWIVAVSNAQGGLGAEDVARLQGACRVLMDFRAEANEVCDSQSSENAQTQRIEDGINAILAHLGHPVAESTPAGEKAEAKTGDPHTRPGNAKRPAKPAASKRPA